MNPVTNCFIYNLEPPFSYKSTKNHITVGSDFKYTINYSETHTSEITLTHFDNYTSYNAFYSVDLLILGELNFDGNIFNIVEGSYIHFNFNVPYGYDYHNKGNTEKMDESDFSTNFKYKFEFEADSKTYHLI